jgi:Protoheme ferro-lyase (ferrochelatase)
VGNGRSRRALVRRGLPRFATDCLETLEEVAMGFTETLAERGATMRYIPCLNDAPAHARALAAIARSA